MRYIGELALRVGDMQKFGYIKEPVSAAWGSTPHQSARVASSVRNSIFANTTASILVSQMISRRRMLGILEPGHEANRVA